MDNEKFKIRVSNKTYYSLINDMHTFDFYKPNGELNKNKFYHAVIRGFYSNYKSTQQDIADVLLKELPNFDTNKITSIALKINDYISSNRHSDKSLKYHPCNIYITVTNDTREMYNDIEINALRNETMSEFIRNLFHEYLSTPQHERERCIFWNSFLQIREALSNSQEIIIKTSNGVSNRFRPFGIFTSDNQTFSYLVGHMVTKKRTFINSIRISRIKMIINTNVSYDFTEDEVKAFEESLSHGPELIGEKMNRVIVKFDNIGVKKYDSLHIGRPYFTECNEETNEYTFDCDEGKLFNYLIQFGKHVKIISPKRLKDKLNNFHRHAIDEDE